MRRFLVVVVVAGVDASFFRHKISLEITFTGDYVISELWQLVYAGDFSGDEW